MFFFLLRGDYVILYSVVEPVKYPGVLIALTRLGAKCVTSPKANATLAVCHSVTSRNFAPSRVSGTENNWVGKAVAKLCKS